MTAFDSFRFPACNFIKKETQKGHFYVNFAKFLRISFERTPRNDCFLSLSMNFEKFSEHLWETAYFMYKLQLFNHQTQQKNISQMLFKTRKLPFEGVHLLKMLWKLSVKNLIYNEVTEETLSHILLHLFCLHFFRMHHNCFFRRAFETVRAQFLSGNISRK